MSETPINIRSNEVKYLRDFRYLLAVIAGLVILASVACQFITAWWLPPILLTLMGVAWMVDAGRRKQQSRSNEEHESHAAKQ